MANGTVARVVHAPNTGEYIMQSGEKQPDGTIAPIIILKGFSGGGGGTDPGTPSNRLPVLTLQQISTTHPASAYAGLTFRLDGRPGILITSDGDFWYDTLGGRVDGQ